MFDLLTLITLLAPIAFAIVAAAILKRVVDQRASVGRGDHGRVVGSAETWRAAVPHPRAEAPEVRHRDAA